MLRFLSKKAQNTAEYAIVLSLVIAAVSGMQIYTKRALQARLKEGTNFLSANKAGYPITTIKPIAAASPTRQYEPYYVKSDFTVDRDSKEVASASGGIWTRSIGADEDVITRKADAGASGTRGYQKYEAPDYH